MLRHIVVLYDAIACGMNMDDTSSKDSVHSRRWANLYGGVGECTLVSRLACSTPGVSYPGHGTTCKAAAHDFHIVCHLLCWASGGGATNSPLMSFTWASHIAASVLTGR